MCPTYSRRITETEALASYRYRTRLPSHSGWPVRACPSCSTALLRDRREPTRRCRSSTRKRSLRGFGLMQINAAKYRHPPSLWLSVLSVKLRRTPTAGRRQRGRGERGGSSGAPSLISGDRPLLREPQKGREDKEAVTASHSWKAGRGTALITRLHHKTTPPVGWVWTKDLPTERERRADRVKGKDETEEETRIAEKINVKTWEILMIIVYDDIVSWRRIMQSMHTG